MRFLLIPLCLLLLPLGVQAQETKETPPTAEATSEADPAKVELAREIIGLTQAGNSLERMAARLVAEMAPVFERANPERGDLVREILETEFLAVFAKHEDQFIDSLIPVYTANFTVADLEALAEFYRSPVGRKLIEAQPAVAEQAMRMGGMWGQKLGELATIRAIQKMQAEGLETNI
ncbi:MAG: DUF2059 domain-containing protein [Geminicoccaceae bacterium]|nr:DUF2059 domain-containing protein [Geminicoccaceae bacterium]